MKICDLCAKKVSDLKPGPPEIEQIEICGDCHCDLLRRFSVVEQRLAETKRQWRAEAIAEWQRARAAKES